MANISYSVEQLAEGILQKNRRMLAKGISLLESTRSTDIEKSEQLLEKLLPYSGKSFRIGISGVPGVGKSTFIESLGLLLLQKGRSIAVLAVDPSSSFSQGSILGDKTRMVNLSQHPEVFIRPSPSSCVLGGVAPRTREAMILCESAGFDTILVETVGVGQSETQVAYMVDFLWLLLLPNAGDELQGIKRGIMEVADGFIVHKADGEQIQAASLTHTQLKNILPFLKPRNSHWQPCVVTCSSVENKGFEEIWNLSCNFFTHTRDIESLRENQTLFWLHSLLQEKLRRLFYEHPQVERLLPQITKEVIEKKKTVTSSVHELLKIFKKDLP